MAASPPVEHQSAGQRLASILPVLQWGRTYNRTWLRLDLMAGLTVAAFAVPEDMAYAALAGLQPQHGLYASIISLLVYACIGTSRQLSYGVTSALSIMVAGSLGAMAFSDPNQYLAAAGFVALLSGAMGVVAWVLRLGFIANFVSESVLTGFSAGAALFIASSQLPKLFGVEGVQGSFFERVGNVLRHLGETNGWTLALGLTCLAILLVMEERFPRLPTALLVVIAAIVVTWVSGLEDRGVEVAGHIPGGLPVPAWPSVDSSRIPELASLAFGVFLLSYIESVGAAKSFAARYRERIDPNQELLANGVSNVASGVMQGYSVGGSMSRSAVNDAAGAKTPLAGAVAAIILCVVLLFLTGPFSHLPEATLAAIVFVAVRRLIDIPAIKRLWAISRDEFATAAAAFLGVLVFGMLEGIIIGVIVTFITILKRASVPDTSVLGVRPGTSEFVDTGRTPEAETIPDILVFRANAGWFYANAPVIKTGLDQAIADQANPPRLVVIDLGPAPALDLGSIAALGDIREELQTAGTDLRLANVYARNHAMITEADPGFAPLAPNQSIADVIATWKADAGSSPANAPANQSLEVVE